jgi:hypothetical protein
MRRVEERGAEVGESGCQDGRGRSDGESCGLRGGGGD